MENRDPRYTLEGMIEMNEGYSTVASTEVEQSKGIGTRGSKEKQNVLLWRNLHL